MNICYKKIISGTALVTLLTFSPGYSFAEVAGNSPVGPVDGEIGNIYIAGHYHGEFFNRIGDLKGKEDATGVKTGAILGWKADGSGPQDYKPKYKSPLFAGGASIGMALVEGIRIELEGLYSQINVDDKDFESEEKAQYVELQRAGTASGNTAEGSDWASIDATARTPAATGVAGNQLIGNPRFAAFKMKNEGFNNIAGMINAYGDFRISEEFEADLYAGVGAGLTKIQFLDKSRFAPAYQIKGGVSFGIPNSPAKVFAGYRYFGVFGDKFKEVKPKTEITAAVAAVAGGPNGANGGADEPARVKSTTATIENSFAVHGIEVGVMYNF